jgi:hypothetical protein
MTLFLRWRAERAGCLSVCRCICWLLRVCALRTCSVARACVRAGLQLHVRRVGIAGWDGSPEGVGACRAAAAALALAAAAAAAAAIVSSHVSHVSGTCT